MLSLFCSILPLIFTSAFAQSPSTIILNGGYTQSWPTELDVAPGQAMVLSVHGLSGRVRDSFPNDVSARTFPLPTELAGISVKVNGQAAALFRVVTSTPTRAPSPTITYIALQIPFGVRPREFGPPVIGGLAVFEEGMLKASIGIVERWSLPHVLRVGSLVGSVFPEHIGVRHADGTSVSPEMPAKPGEVLTLYAVGLGLSSPRMPFGAGEPSAEGFDVPVGLAFTFGRNPRPGPIPDYRRSQNGSLPPVAPELVSARFLPGKAGLYEVKFRVPDVPSGTRACGTYPEEAWLHNMAVNLGYINWFSPWENRQDYDGIAICVEVPEAE